MENITLTKPNASYDMSELFVILYRLETLMTDTCQRLDSKTVDILYRNFKSIREAITKDRFKRV
jgi:hypothetical protein